MRRFIRTLLARAYRSLQPQLDPEAQALINTQARLLNEAATRESAYRADYVERASELIEARQMAGAGPWLVHESRGEINKPGPFKIREAIDSAGAAGDLDLMLSNVEWRREVNLSWLEFSRWGIQQIILISRLYYIKNPLIQRGINVAAHYVFGRGVEVSSPDESANEVLKEFFEANKSTLGQIALVDLERRKYYDGNLFFAFFSDTSDTGSVSVRTIDATEIMDIVTDPDDTDKPRYYRRCWTERAFDAATGRTATLQREAWYPALGYMPEVDQINSSPVMKNTPVLHRKCGGVSKWLFGCPLVYAAIDWAKASKKFLEACATVKSSLAQIALTLTMPGGQQALEGAKQQLQSNVGTPGSGPWDTNPPAVAGSIFAAGPNTKLEAFKSSGQGGDPEEVRRFILMVACVFGLPETFFADVKTGNLATAQSLDRPTELNFLEKQEAWREDLMTISKYVLSVSMGAAAGRLREAHGGIKVRIVEAERRVNKRGKLVELKAAPKPGEITVSVNFPEILEGDLSAKVLATVDAMTLGNRAGQIVGIDQKDGVRKLYDDIGIENGEERTEEMYPEGSYEVDRSKQILPQPIGRNTPGGQPEDKIVRGTVGASEALSRRLARRLIESIEEERNGAEHVHSR